MEPRKPVVFFDGHCNLCNRWVDWVVRLDKTQRVFVASLQGETASRLLPGEKLKNPETFLLYENSELFCKSNAVFRLAEIIKGPLILLLFFRWLPGKFADWIYDLVAKNRYRFAGRRQSCRVPEENEKKHFLQ